MISKPRTHKGAVLIAAYVMFSCVVALLSVNLTSPTSAALGADWQCSRFALVFTSCTPVRVHEAVSAGMHKADLVHDKPDTVLRMSAEISGCLKDCARRAKVLVGSCWATGTSLPTVWIARGYVEDGG